MESGFLSTSARVPRNDCTLLRTFTHWTISKAQEMDKFLSLLLYHGSPSQGDCLKSSAAHVCQQNGAFLILFLMLLFFCLTKLKPPYVWKYTQGATDLGTLNTKRHDNYILTALNSTFEIFTNGNWGSMLGMLIARHPTASSPLMFYCWYTQNLAF